MFIQRFLDWLNYEDLPNGRPTTDAPPRRNPRRALPAPPPPRQIAQRSLLSPERLAEMAADYEETLREAANEQYQSFLSSSYPNFVQWVELLVEKSANFGGRFLLLTFDNSTGIVTAATPGPRQIFPPTPYALPISQSAVQTLAAAVADHFQKADFQVHLTHHDQTDTRLGTQLTPAYDCIDIIWAELGTNKPILRTTSTPSTYTMFPTCT